ncbi:hypothetical protein C7M84_013084, partial [Penaeus vannamei]
MDGDGNGASGKDRDERDESGEKQDNLRVTKTGRVRKRRRRRGRKASQPVEEAVPPIKGWCLKRYPGLNQRAPFPQVPTRRGRSELEAEGLAPAREASDFDQYGGYRRTRPQ